MTCPRCQQDNPTHARFCLGCGARLALACGACGAELPGDARFCLQCGQAVAGSAAAPVRSATPKTYTPKHLAEKILTSKAALEGERKQVTVLFADLKGSMELLADRDPEDARKLLDPVLEHMMEAVHRFEGTVNQVMGDGIMALFGAPLAHEDHAVRACYAALRMQESVRRYAEGVRRVEGISIQIRVGLNSGEVVVRAIGSDLRMDYSAIGQTTHLAARMEQMAVPGSVLMTANTLELAEGFIQVEPLGHFPVKGLGAPVEVYEVIGVEPVRSRLHATAVRGLTRFVGRDPEMEQIRLALERVHQGHGQVVAVVGEPGVGKSRLYWEFIHSHRTKGCLVLESRSVSYGKATSYLPVIDLLKGYFAIEARDDPRRLREKVTGRLLSLDESLRPRLPAFLALLGLPVDDVAWQALEPPHRRQRTLDAIKGLLLRESHVQPLILVFEDLHWIDSETQAVLDSLIESLPMARVLLLVNYRPEYEHTWGRKTYYLQLRIDPLPPQNAEAMVNAPLGQDRTLEQLKRALIERTEGNPFFLEESVRTLRETGVLIGEQGACRVATNSLSIQVPATVQVILAGRIDRLPLDEKALLQTASVIGKDVPLPVLQAIAGQSEEELRGRLSRLQAAEFLYETRLFPDVEFTFKHALTHDVAYSSLLQERRRELHARVMAAIEQHYPDRLTEHLERLCYHADRAELWAQSFSYARQAGWRAFERSANRDAVVYFERGLTALSHLPHADLADSVDIRIDLRRALWAAGDITASARVLREAEHLARALDDPRRMAQTSVALGHSLVLTGRIMEARDWAERGLAIAESLHDVPIEASACLYAGSCCVHIGELDRAQEYLERVVHLLSADRIRERAGMVGYPAVISRCYLAYSFAERGLFDGGLHYAQEAIQIAELLDHPYSLVNAWWALGYHQTIQGKWAEAQRLLETALNHCQSWGLTGMVPMVRYRLGYLYGAAGHAAEGVREVEEAVEEFASMGFDWGAWVQVPLGQVYLLAGRATDAFAVSQQALAIARHRGARLHEAYAGWLVGEAAALVSDLALAERHYRDGLKLATDLGMRPLVAHCHLGLGKLYRRMDRGPEAQEHLTTAATMYREMGMTFWLEKAGAELGGGER